MSASRKSFHPGTKDGPRGGGRLPSAAPLHARTRSILVSLFVSLRRPLEMVKRSLLLLAVLAGALPAHAEGRKRPRLIACASAKSLPTEASVTRARPLRAGMEWFTGTSHGVFKVREVGTVIDPTVRNDEYERGDRYLRFLKLAGLPRVSLCHLRRSLLGALIASRAHIPRSCDRASRG